MYWCIIEFMNEDEQRQYLLKKQKSYIIKFLQDIGNQSNIEDIEEFVVGTPYL